ALFFRKILQVLSREQHSQNRKTVVDHPVVIAVVVLVLILLLAVILRYMYKHKGTYHTNEAKGTEFAETADAALRGDPALKDAMDESKKEYFI
uniref:Glycophorin C (Gerbich blood group) n=1 Tax=Cyprinus carpio carpio TaxID=630221 RepID=A0A9J8DGX2_CYPCA